ncbi:MAG: 7-cyano-7-deazaguanine synthase QueC [Deltaproteobacteria bacterium RIFOXYA12_FULL_58_15]|nr:MAG: 7-cyano-7-deazaguanine synthase QueC [Deltaproteobacteria bacterium RIFOXYA12_FULL_58_15]
MLTAASAVVLLSGGLDSTTTLAMAKAEGFACHALSFNYGQRHKIELDAATRVAEALGVAEHLILSFDLGTYGGSALTGNHEVPKDRSTGVMGRDIPITYVPARNTIFLAHALGWAEVLGAFDLFIGANAVDYSGYPDCRPEFISAFESLANLATGAGVTRAGRFRIHAPLLHMTKAEIVKKGTELGVDYSLTHSCYDPKNEIACGRCDACQLRLAGFAAAGLKDPIAYVQKPMSLTQQQVLH